MLKRAENRVKNAVTNGTTGTPSPNQDVEIASFPIATIIASSTKNPYLKRTYALAEAKIASSSLKNEKKETILAIAKNFQWKIQPKRTTGCDFTLHFTNFLENSTNLRSKKWKLVNRQMINGEVHITKAEATRLLEEEIRRRIEENLNKKVKSLPQNITSLVEQLTQLFIEKRGKTKIQELPKDIATSAFPPCMKQLYDTAKSGRPISHISRFALTSFLINIGMPVEEVVNLFRSSSDFNERMTRYQVEHIAGERGSRTKYLPPKCSMLRTHGICVNPNEICKKIRHPLTYYRRKLISKS
ncbi:MAG: DNA primase large subunit PriL [Thermoproteota archaeon]|nr:DNA primase large subunit PriL [Thermoproteota archaeon]